MADPTKDDLFQQRLGEIEERAAESLPAGALVVFGAFELDADGLPVDNLDKVAVEGRCIFMQKHDPFFGKGKDFTSGEFSSPTWLQVCWVANEMIHVTGDQHHVFLEGVRLLKEENGVKCLDLEMGS